MIGWRVYAVTAAALVFLAGGVIDAGVTYRESNKEAAAKKKTEAAKKKKQQAQQQESLCDAADQQRENGLFTSAAARYRKLLEASPSLTCARTGLSETVARQCAYASALAEVDSAEGRKQLQAIAVAEPPSFSACAREALGALPGAAG